MIICIDKRTDTVVPDFQGKPRAGTLIKNAVRSAKAKGEDVTEDDFEEREVTREVFKQHIADFKSETQAAREAEKQERDDAVEGAKQLLAKLDFTDEMVKVMFPHFE